MSRVRAFRLPLLLLLAFALLGGACLGGGAIHRSYYVLHGVTLSSVGPTIKGQVRVRNLDAASIYEKFQIVVRRSPYELSYSETDVWAVKPNRMISDVIAEALTQANGFSSVVRELGDLRPDYILSGDLHAIEVYDSDDVWYAHLAIILQLSRFDTGQTLLTFSFDQRKHVPSRTFSQAARALSELLSTALDDFIGQLMQLSVARTDEVNPAAPATMTVKGAADEANTDAALDARSATDSSASPRTPPPPLPDASHADEDGAASPIFVPVGGKRNIGDD